MHLRFPFYRGDNSNQQLKIDLMGLWIEKDWLPEREDTGRVTVTAPNVCMHDIVLARVDDSMILPGGYLYAGYSNVACSVLPQVNMQDREGEITFRTGAFIHRFTRGQSTENGHSEEAAAETVEVLFTASFVSDEYDELVCLANLPESFLPAWATFVRECRRIFHTMSPREEVVIIGGRRSTSFVPTVDWEDIVLPETLKDELFEDVVSFFGKGIDIYKRLKLKPFRKLLLAGVPGTGKTMLCSALAKWALDQGHHVIYISSADQEGPTFRKIEDALYVASRAEKPTLVILEEIDAYLHDKEKSIVLNVLDGSEGIINEHGTLLVATTNYPEAIDERVLKRPGRLDRIFIIPKIKHADEAEVLLQKHLGDLWRDEHRGVAARLAGFPGAFIREVAIHALTQVAYDDLQELPLPVLEDSFRRLKEQIDAKDEFLKIRVSSDNHHDPFNM